MLQNLAIGQMRVQFDFAGRNLVNPEGRIQPGNVVGSGFAINDKTTAGHGYRAGNRCRQPQKISAGESFFVRLLHEKFSL
jgi:hypothetical protein